jgi:hypothetical protein
MSVMQQLMMEVMGQIKESGEAEPGHNLEKILSEVRQNYQSTMEDMIRLNNYQPLLAEEIAKIEAHQNKLIGDCNVQYKEIMSGMDEMKGKLQLIYGEILSQTEENKRTRELQSITIPQSDIDIVNKIAGGGFGDVHLGLFKERDRVAIKVIENKDGRPLSDKQIREAENEVLMLNIVRNGLYVLQAYGLVYDGNKKVMMVFELAPYGSLWSVLQDFETLPASSIPITLQLVWCSDLAEAVGFIHGLGVRHRDIKPQNLLLYHSPNRLVIKLCDFGLAKQSMGALTATHSK